MRAAPRRKRGTQDLELDLFREDRPSPRRRRAPRGNEKLRPELAVERFLGLGERAAVGAGGEIFPATIGDQEGHVGAPPRLDRLVRDIERRMQDRARGEAREEAFDLDELPGTQHRVAGADGEAAGEDGGVVELGDVALVEVAEAVDELAVAGSAATISMFSTFSRR